MARLQNNVIGLREIVRSKGAPRGLRAASCPAGPSARGSPPNGAFVVFTCGCPRPSRRAQGQQPQGEHLHDI